MAALSSCKQECCVLKVKAQFCSLDSLLMKNAAV